VYGIHERSLIALWAPVVALLGAAMALLAPMGLDSAVESQGPAHVAGEKVKLPQGTPARPRLSSPAPRVRGEIGPPREASRGDEPRATALELSVGPDNDVTLIDARSLGFRVELGDGRIMVVPAGRLRIEAEASRYKPATRSAVSRQLSAIDPLRMLGQADPFPFERALVLELRDGDRVEVATNFDEHWQSGEGYRMGKQATLTPRGVPLIRLLR
jgi:hypothetical protein